MAQPTRDTARGNLRDELSSFVGRREQIAEVKRALATTRLVTLSGPGGIGKTRLAVQSAKEVRRAFRDGVFMIELARQPDPALLATEVARGLGLLDQSATWAVARLSDRLAASRTLLILDGCEHVLDACAVLAQTLLRGCPGVRVIATSRQMLGVSGEVVLRVPPLSLPGPDETPTAKDLAAYEAVRLFVQRGAAVVPGFRLDDRNAPAVAGVCERLEGLPLAIELAAVRLRSLSPEQILQRLENRFHLLSGGGPAATPRHKTLEATIAWSYDLLSEAEQTLWRMASIFSGSFDLEAAERVCATDAVPRGMILDLTDALVAKSILVGDSSGPRTRYRMLDTLREYGQRGHPDPGERLAARRRHRDWYSSLAARQDWLGPHQVQWVDALRAEHLNLRAALEYCLSEPGEAEAGLRLACDLWLYWETNGHLTEGRRVMDAVLAHIGHPPILRARALWVAGYLALAQGEAARSAELLKQALGIGRRLADQETIAYASQFRGRALWFMGDAVHGLSLTLEAQELHRKRGDAWGLVLTLVQLGVMRALTGDPRGAVAPFAECQAVCEEHGERWNRSYAQWGLGLSRWLLGETAGAEALVLEALGTKRHVGDRAGTPLCLDTLALIAAADGRMARAATLLGAAEATWRSIPATPPEPFGPGRDACSAKVRKALGRASFQAAFQRGLGLDPVQAVAFALGGVPPAPRATRAVRGPAGLSPREEEVASLVACGLSNREIAASLVISARTAETHVQHIMDKLGFTSRAQIGAWAGDRSREGRPTELIFEQEPRRRKRP